MSTINELLKLKEELEYWQNKVKFKLIYQCLEAEIYDKVTMDELTQELNNLNNTIAVLCEKSNQITADNLRIEANMQKLEKSTKESANQKEALAQRKLELETENHNLYQQVSINPKEVV